MYLKGVSTRKTKKITEKLCGTEFSRDQVSRFAKKLDKKGEAWRNRQLSQEYPYLVIDARYEQVREGGTTKSVGVLIVKGVREDNKREIIAVEVANTENETTWSNLFRNLKDRGLSGVRYIVSDRHKRLKKAIDRHFQGVIWQRCQEHWTRNAVDRVAKTDPEELREDLQDALHAPRREKAEDRIDDIIEELIEDDYEDLATWIEETVEETLQVYQLPGDHHKRMRTTNSLERFMQEIKRRTKVIRVFPDRQNCRRLVAALCMEQSEDGVTGYDYLDMSLLDKEETPEQMPIRSSRKENDEAPQTTFTEKG